MRTCDLCVTGAFLYQLTYEATILTSLPICGFIAQLVEQRTGNAEVTGSHPVEALIFFRLLLSNCLKLENLLRWSFFSFNNIIIGLPVSPNYKMGFLCRKNPEKPEKSVIIIYTSQNITCILKPLHCTIGSLMNPLYGGLVKILKTSAVHCNYYNNYWTMFFYWTRPYSCICWGKLKRLCLKSPLP